MKEKMKKIIKGKKGITLIALVISVIILIILVGVLINLTISNNGLFTKAKLAKNSYEEAVEDENTKINDAYGQILIATEGTLNNIDAQTLQQQIKTKAINYSAEQQAVGTWMGNKTLYQKTFTGIANEYDNTGNYVVGSIPEDAHIIKIEGFVYWHDGAGNNINYCGGTMLPFNNTNGDKVICLAFGSGGNIAIQSSLKTVWPYTITVQYTID